MSRVVTPERVVRGACRFFLRHGTIDMGELAASMAISRATLYRVVHSRDALLGEVLWRLGDALLIRARRARQHSGVDGVIEVTRLFTAQVRAAEPFRAFLRAEPETAARVLLTASGGVHRRAVLAQQEILRENSGPAWSPASPHQQAYLYVRLVESALYADLLDDARLDPGLAERAARALLVAPSRACDCGLTFPACDGDRVSTRLESGVSESS
jgi:AcrR family transcriptional regulator